LSNSLYLLWHQLAHSNVVQKEERLGTTGEDIINAMINQVNTNGIMLGQSTGNFQLGAYPIYTGYQNRLLKPLKLKESAKEAWASQDFRAMGRFGVLAN
jgi:hypothetical protein